ncbi:MAG: DNA replication/repair protein RecF [Clostridiales bacterium]|nr:DNA replication/repair protein RecF [Clostridiales bacterium]
MIIESIHLTDFRNYRRLDLDVGPSVNIFYGFNAQGKTNIIEAVNVCSCLSSHRTSKDRDMISFGEKGFEIKIDLLDPEDNYKTDLSVSYLLEKTEKNPSSVPKRILKQDSLQISKVASYLGICNTVIFAPEDLNLIKGAPSVRRKFLNLIISKTSPSYFDLLNRYNRLIGQKNACLKSFRGGRPDDDKMDFWDYPLADISAEIILYRYRYSLLLSKYASKHHLNISGEKEDLKISYSTIQGSVELINAFLKENASLDSFIDGSAQKAIYVPIKAMLSEHLLSKFRATRQNDSERGITGTGIHKDDLDITLNGLPMKNFSSQGQQRSAALSLKLSELYMIREFCRTSPILLLDDVFSELDVNRRVSLISGMVNAQIFITCTEREYIEKELGSLVNGTSLPRYFHVENGNVTPE